MKILLITFSLLIIGCDFNRKVRLPSSEVTKEIEVKVRDLGIRIKSIDELKVLAQLSEPDATHFQQRMRELKSSYNRTSSLIKDSYKDEGKRELELEYRNTLAIWDYIVFNFPI
jgi:hypothetical protein